MPLMRARRGVRYLAAGMLAALTSTARDFDEAEISLNARRRRGLIDQSAGAAAECQPEIRTIE